MLADRTSLQTVTHIKIHLKQAMAYLDFLMVGQSQAKFNECRAVQGSPMVLMNTQVMLYSSQ